MTLRELEATLPNGFHDALLHRLEWDLEQRTVVLVVSVWVGDLHDQVSAAREQTVRQRLVLQGVRFFEIEQPSSRYPYQAARPVRFELRDLDRAHPLMKEQPSEVFGASLFVEEWNAFVHLAAEDAELIPVAAGGA